jgi:hypothetical protein
MLRAKAKRTKKSAAGGAKEQRHDALRRHVAEKQQEKG